MLAEDDVYGILAEQVRKRRAPRQHPAYVKPQLVATAPNQVWSWAATIDRPMIDRLFDLVLVEQRENVQLEGGSVLGRTMIA